MPHISCIYWFLKCLTVLQPVILEWHPNIIIHGPFYRIIKNVYSKCQSQVKLGITLMSTFRCQVGVRQGDVLCPNLFRILMNELPEQFDKSCDPWPMNPCQFSCLMYADGIVQVSISLQGLQKCLYKLSVQNYGPAVNPYQSKTMIYLLKKTLQGPSIIMAWNLKQ